MKNFSILPRDTSCDILVKKVVAFCLCLKCQLEAKVKSFGLILFWQKKSQQPTIDFVFWLLMVGDSKEELQ